MKNHTFIFLTFFCIFIVVTSCKKPIENPPVAEIGHISFKFTHLVDGQPLQTDTMMYVNAAGNPYSIYDLRYFISDVTLHKSGGTTKIISDWKDIDYVDNSIPSTLTWAVYDSIPVGSYDSISFTFGISAAKNISFMFVNPPEVNMMWPDLLGGGYHYMMINGKWKDSINQVENFNFHLGIGQLYHSNAIDNTDSIYAFVQNYFHVTLPNSAFTITEGTTRHVEIIMNIDSWFKTPHNWDFNHWGQNIMQNQAAMQTVKENGHDVFTTGMIN